MKLEIRPSIFREYDIRGIAGKDISPEFATCLGKAYALFISGRTPVASRKKLTVSVGWDCRLSSDSYAAALISGLRQGGLDVVQLDVCPTPLTYFSLFELDLDGAIMVTGSHNPADYNGFKICVGKDTIHGQQIQELRALMEKVASETGFKQQEEGSLSSFAVIPSYINYLVQHARPLKSKKNRSRRR